MKTDRVRVLVIDDSAFNRRTIVKMLESLPNVEVIGYACDGEEGLRKVIDLRPDLITLDLEMPRMDGFTLLRIVMQKQPTPVIVVSSRSDDEDVFKALDFGAVAFVPKPSSRVSPVLMNIRDELLEKVKEVTSVNLDNVMARASTTGGVRHSVPSVKVTDTPPAAGPDNNFPVVAIGSSTGGPPALQNIFSAIQEPLPIAFVVAQHMPPDFTRAFAERLNRFSAMNIREAQSGDIVKPGDILIAPGGKNLEFFPKDNEVMAKVSEPRAHQRYLPSVDTLFSSCAAVFGPRLLGVVLTGMGNDGAMGASTIKAQGGTVFAESEETSVVFGMPKEAIASGAVDEVLALPDICRRILQFCGVNS